ncbi:hypothetical protein [Chryseobacterium sp. SC28]|nr:hypothetical protein [Chryseobacterium sp. SC28]
MEDFSSSCYPDVADLQTVNYNTVRIETMRILPATSAATKEAGKPLPMM